MTRTIDTLGRALRHQMLLQVSCRRCSRLRLYECQGLATRFGLGRDPLRLNFVCATCRRRCRLVLLEARDLPQEAIVLRLEAGGWVTARLGR
jgi:hypothetical protein